MNEPEQMFLSTLIESAILDGDEEFLKGRGLEVLHRFLLCDISLSDLRQAAISRMRVKVPRVYGHHGKLGRPFKDYADILPSLLADVRNGVGVAGLLKKYNIGYAVIKRLCLENGVAFLNRPRNRRDKVLSSDNLKLIYEDYDTGVSKFQLTKKYKISYPVINRVLAERVVD